MRGSAGRRNILLILTDDHAASTIGAYGSIVNTTPRIDEIAAAGWRFDRCFVANSEPHPRHADRYVDPIPRPRSFFDDYATRSASVRRTTMRVADHLASEDLKQDPPEGLPYDEAAGWKYQRMREDYLRSVASVDEGVGRMIDRLRERGEFDDTLLLYTSDQGFFLGEHGWFDKRLVYEEALRMPLLLCCPRRLDGGRVFDGMVTNVDWARTILAAAGVEPHPRMPGRSFWPDLLGAPEPPPAEGSTTATGSTTTRATTRRPTTATARSGTSSSTSTTTGSACRAPATGATRRSGSSTTRRRTPTRCGTWRTTRRARPCGPTSRSRCGASRRDSATGRIRRNRFRPAHGIAGRSRNEGERSRHEPQQRSR
jgi:arylsulfatase A-like enzyme